MVDLMYNRLTCCQPFGNKVTTKLAAKVMLSPTALGDMPKLAMGTPKHNDFLDFNWNFTDARVASTFSLMLSLGPNTEGN